MHMPCACLRVRVDRRERVVEEQQLGRAVECACECDALLLPSRERDASLSHLGELAEGQRGEVRIERARLMRGAGCRARGIGRSAQGAGHGA